MYWLFGEDRTAALERQIEHLELQLKNVTADGFVTKIRRTYCIEVQRAQNSKATHAEYIQQINKKTGEWSDWSAPIKLSQSGRATIHGLDPVAMYVIQLFERDENGKRQRGVVSQVIQPIQ